MDFFRRIRRWLLTGSYLLLSSPGWCAEDAGAKPIEAPSPPSPANVEPSLIPWAIGTLAVLAVLAPLAWQLTRRRLAHWSVPRRITAGFGLILTVLTILGLGGYLGLHRSVLAFIDYRRHADDALLAGQIQSNFVEMRLAAKDYQITRKAEDIQQYAARAGESSKFLKEAQAEFTDEDERALLTPITDNVTRHRELFQQMQAATADAAIAEIGAKMAQAGTAADRQIEELQLVFVNRQHSLGKAVSREVKQIQAAIACAAVGAVLFGSFLAWLIGRSVVTALATLAGDLANGAAQTAAASAQMSSASQILAQGTSEQAASLEETSASLEELTAMVRRNAEAAAKAKQFAGETRSSAETGATDMAEMQSAMNDIKTSSGEVAKIAQAIDAIAFQTNILALNAAVEAARAGDAGMGFAVVADEVRTLAQRSATSARETAARIEDALLKTDRGGAISAKVATGLELISQRTQEVDRHVAEIASASSEQSLGVSHINQAVTQLDRATQNNAAVAEESAAAAEELASQAEALKGAAETLQELAGITTVAAASKKPEPKPSAKRPTPPAPSAEPVRPHARARRPQAAMCESSF